MHYPPKTKGPMLASYKAAIEAMKYIGELDQECILCVTLDGDWNTIGEHVISIGGMEETGCDPRILLNRVLLDKATRFLIGHNHPNGKAFFSPEDLILVSYLKVVSAILDIQLVDSILFPHGKEPVCMKFANRKFMGSDFDVRTKAFAESFVDGIKS